VSEDLTLVPEVQARRQLRKQPVRIVVLAPYGTWIGCGMLRVLRLKMPPFVLREAQDSAQDDRAQDDGMVELTVGYESYEPLAVSSRAAEPEGAS
jgi:hypothetical protein